MIGETLFVRIKAVDQFTGTFNKVQGQAAATGKSFNVMGAVAVAGTAAIAAGLYSCVKAAMENEKAIADMEQAIKSTGGAANVTSQHVQDLATTIQNYSGYSDEAVISASSMMLTFKKVRNEAGKNNDIFDRSVKITADLARRFGMDLPSATKMLGKALEDPILGLTAMRRAGVSFDDAQKAMIKNMTLSGDVIGAQKYILAELETQVGGAAEAYGKTLAGKIEIAKQKFVDLKEIIGHAIIPALTKVADATIEGMDAVAPAIGEAANRLGDMAAEALEASAIFDTLTYSFKGLAVVLKFLTDTGLGEFLKNVNKWASQANVAIGGLLNPFAAAGEIASWFGETTQKVAGYVATAAQDMARGIDSVAKKLEQLATEASASLEQVSQAVARLEGELSTKGLSGVVNEDLEDMILGFMSTEPRVRDESEKMMKAILESEARANPQIREEMSNIMEGIKTRIEQTPAGERTAELMNQIIQEEVAKGGPITAEMQNIMNQLAGIVSGTDLTIHFAISGIQTAMSEFDNFLQKWKDVRAQTSGLGDGGGGGLGGGRGGGGGLGGGRGASGGGPADAWAKAQSVLDKFRAKPVDDVAEALKNLINVNWDLITPLEQNIATYDTLISQSELMRLKAEQAGDEAAMDWWAQTKAAQENARSIEQVQLELNKAEQAQAGLNDETQKALAAWAEMNRLYQEAKDSLKEADDALKTFAKTEETLNALRSAGIKGEYAQSDKEFAKQQQIKQAQLDLIKAEERGDREKAATLREITLPKLQRQLEKMQLEGDIKYDPARHAIDAQFREAEQSSKAIRAAIRKALGGKKYADWMKSYKTWKERAVARGERVQTFEQWMSGFSPGAGGMAGGGVNININAGAFAGTPAQAKRFAKWINGYIKQEAKR